MMHKCPICKAQTDSAVHTDFPFCSERCRLRDLGNWASEKYVVSDPIFDEGDRAAVNDEEENGKAKRKTIILDQPNLDDDKH
jgi:endogenous inhibitor of DNA gyrase (YacG/DUF329 family)